MNKRRKILVLMPTLSGGGAERAILDVIGALDSDAFDIKIGAMSVRPDDPIDPKFLIAPQQVSYISKPANEKYAALSDGLRYIVGTFRLVNDYLLNFKPDVVLTVTESMNILSLFYKIRFRSVPAKWVLRVGNNSLRELKDAFPNPVIHRLMKWIYTIAYRRASHIIAISNGVKSMLVSQFGVNPLSVTVIHNPVNVTRIQHLSTKFIEAPPTFLLSIGRLSDYQKRTDMLIEAYNGSLAHHRNIPLILLGKYSENDRFFSRVNELKLEKHVLFKGFQSNPYAWMSRAYAMLHAAAWEGFCSVIAESLACGTPVIATDCDYGPREIIQAGKNGILVPIGDVDAFRSAIDQMVETQGLRDAFAAFPSHIEKRFNVSTIANQYAMVLNEGKP